MKIDTALPAPVSILMPVCNEAAVIEEVVEEWVRDVISRLPQGSELVIDEAGSTDETRPILERLRLKYPFMRVYHQPVKDGFAAAARRLYQSARCPLVFFTDSDGQYVPSEFWKLAPFVKEFSLVHGAKVGRQDSFFRKLASAAFNRIARLHFDFHYSDINCAFRIIKKEALDNLLPAMGRMPTLFNAELLLRAELNNYSIKQVRVMHRPRRFGASRGLPLHRFPLEAFKAYRGLLALKAEFRYCPP